MSDRKKVTIGSEYRETYESLVKILKSGSVQNTGARVETGRDGGTVICTDAAEYVYADRVGTGISGGNVSIAMGRDGASWFAPVRRGKAFDDGTSEWKQLIFKVAHEFHDQFPIIEYKQCDGSGESEGAEVEKSVRAIVSRFFGVKNAAVIKGSDKRKGSEDIYGASVKLELSGTGQSHYVVMCKIYFRRAGKGISPLSAAEAMQINAKLEEADNNDEPIRLTADDTADINNVTLHAVRNLVNGNYPISFRESLCFSTRRVINPATGQSEDNYDLKTYKFLASRARANNAPVTCDSVQVLGISHVKWINDYYDVAFGGKVVLQAVVGFGGSITLRCVNCGGGNLVTSNTVTYVAESEGGVKQTVNVVLDYSKKDLGIDDNLLAELRKHGELGAHLSTVRCPQNVRTGTACSAMKCRSQTVVIDGEIKCADCPYPEVVYTDYSGDRPVRYLTSKMAFVTDKLAMALAENAAVCQSCGRKFTREALVGGTCPVCTRIDGLGGAELARAKKLYSKYRNVFPHLTRMRHAFDKKYCVEDDTALVFALGSERYVLAKTEIGDAGFVKQPAKIR